MMTFTQRVAFFRVLFAPETHAGRSLFRALLALVRRRLRETLFATALSLCRSIGAPRTFHSAPWSVSSTSSDGSSVFSS